MEWAVGSLAISGELGVGRMDICINSNQPTNSPGDSEVPVILYNK